jgi:CDP-glucose 4,6-dehydratase
MKALITGIEGFLGSNLALELQSRGHEVVGTSLNRRGETSLEALGLNCRIEYGDVTDSYFIDRAIAASECDVVFHLAAISVVRVAEKLPALALRTNILGTLNVVNTCKRLGVKCIVASSDKAYGDHGGLPYTEDMPLKPTGAYEVSKTCADHIGILYGAIVVRCANLYGPGDLNFSRMIPKSCKLSSQNKAPEIYGDAVNDKREWLYIWDAVRAYIALAESGLPGAYNVGSGEQASPMEVGVMISKLTGCPMPDIVSKKNEFYEIPEQILSCEKIRGLGWEPYIRLSDGLLNTSNWYREYLK